MTISIKFLLFLCVGISGKKRDAWGGFYHSLWTRVTLELYRLECHGSLAEAIPWDVTMSRWKEGKLQRMVIR